MRIQRLVAVLVCLVAFAGGAQADQKSADTRSQAEKRLQDHRNQIKSNLAAREAPPPGRPAPHPGGAGASQTVNAAKPATGSAQPDNPSRRPGTAPPGSPK